MLVLFLDATSLSLSFPRKMDMLNIDLGLQNSYDDRRKSKQAAKPSTKKTTNKKSGAVVTEDDWAEDEAAFHFSAYVPIDGELWKLDGLDRQPQRLEKFDSSSDWLSVATPILEKQMTEYAAGDIEFVLLSLVRDPLIMLRADLARNVKSLQAVERRLDSIQSEWRAFLESGSDVAAEVMLDQDPTLGITEEAIADAVMEADTAESVDGTSAEKLTKLRQELVTSQHNLRRMTLEEIESAADDDRKANERRCDYGPAIYTWLKMLAEKDGVMKELVDAVR